MSRPRMISLSAAAQKVRRPTRTVRYHAMVGNIPGAERQFDRGPWKIPSEWADAHTPLTAAKTSTGF